MKNKFYLTIFLAILVVFTMTGLSCGLTAPTGEGKDELEPITLEYWRVWDSPQDFSEILASYKARRSHINVKIKQFTYEQYEEAIRDAYAEDRAPDIISLHNTWLKKYKEKEFIAPMPETIIMPEVMVTGPSWYRRTRIENKKRLTLSLQSLQEDFVDVVKKDVLFSNQIYGLPLAVDTLILFYNKDILNNEGIAQPPKTWSEFYNQVKEIVKEDRLGNILLAGAAIGRGDNVLRSSDILSLLMMQNGATMADAQGKATFGGNTRGENFSPAEDALRFYTDFASPVKEIYTWNKSMANSLEAFTTSKAAFFFGYPYHLKTIRSKGPGLNLGLAPIPQTGNDQEINYASYWVEAVSKKSSHLDEAWDFLLFATSAQSVQSYLDNTKRTTALRSLIDQQKNDLAIGKVVNQVLTAKSWYHGRNSNAAELFMREMIDLVVDGKTTIRQAINEAVQKINQTI